MLLHANLLAFSPTIPLTQGSRGGSSLASLALYLFGILLHNMLPQAWNLAWPKWHVAHDPDAHVGNDFHRMVRSKIHRSKIWLSSDNVAMKSLGLSLGVVCAVRCLQRIQYLDKDGGMLLKVVTKSGCPFRECFARCQTFIVAPLQTSAYVLQRLFADDVLHAAFRHVFACVVALVGRVWFLFDL